MIRKIRQKTIYTLAFLLSFIFLSTKHALAFPIYAQQAYENPREANGRIVCANCHLAQKPVEIELPTSTLPNSIFEAIVRIPFDATKKQLLENGKRGDLNIGAILMMPDGFKLAPKNQLESRVKAKMKGVYITPYSSVKENILLVGPINGEKNKEIIFPLLAPDPAKNKNVHYLKYLFHIGANRGRAQVNPNGEKTNNNSIVAEATGKVAKIIKGKNNSIMDIAMANGDVKSQIIPNALLVTAKESQFIMQDEPVTENPNVGGFGQVDAEIVLQDPMRIYAYSAFCFLILLAQTALVLKKKQFEKVQMAESDF